VSKIFPQKLSFALTLTITDLPKDVIYVGKNIWVIHRITSFKNWKMYG